MASGTRKAFAISVVVSPPTARSVRASCEGGGQRGVAAQEEEREGVVPLGRLARAAHVERGGGLLAVPAGAFAPPSVDQPPVRHGREPRARALGDAVLAPLLRRGEQRLLHGILARVELPVPPHERAEDLRRELAQQVLDAGVVHRVGHCG